MSNTKDLRSFSQAQQQKLSDITQQNLDIFNKNELYKLLSKVEETSDIITGYKELLTAKIQRAYFGREGQETYWYEFNLIELLAEFFGSVEEIQKIIEEYIIKPIESVIEAIKIIDDLLATYASFIISLISPWIIFLRSVINLLKKLIKDLLSLFTMNLLGGSIKVAIPNLKIEPGTIRVNYRSLYPLLESAVNEWPNRPEGKDSIHAFIFIPYSLIGVANPYSGTLLNNIQDVIDDAENIFTKKALEKYLEFKSNIVNSIKQVYEDGKIIHDNIVKTFSYFPFNERTPGSIIKEDVSKQIINYQNNLKEKVNLLLKDDNENYKIVVSSIVNSIFNRNEISNKCLLVGSSEIYLNNDSRNDLCIKINPSRNNGIIIHKISLCLKDLTGNTPINEIEDIYINPRTLPLQIFKLIEKDVDNLIPILQTYKEYLLYKNTKEFLEQILPGSDGSIEKIIRKNLYNDIIDDDEVKRFLILRELFFSLKDLSFKNYKDLSSKIKGNTLSTLIENFDYITRYFMSSKNHTPYDLYFTTSEIQSQNIKETINNIKNKKQNDKYALYISIELLNTDALLFGDSFYESNIETLDLIMPGWYNGSLYAEKNSSLYIKKIGLEQKSDNLIFNDRWYGADILPDASFESMLAFFWPKGKKIIKDVQNYSEDTLNYLDTLLLGLDSSINSIAGIIRDFADILTSMRLDFLNYLLNLIRSLTFDDIPLILFGIWYGDANKMSSLIWSGLSEKRLTTSTKGGIILYAELNNILFLLQLFKTKKEIEEKADLLSTKLSKPTELLQTDMSIIVDPIVNKMLPDKIKVVQTKVQVSDKTKDVNNEDRNLILYNSLDINEVLEVLKRLSENTAIKEPSFRNVELKVNKKIFY